jgi:hypothetical protein
MIPLGLLLAAGDVEVNRYGRRVASLLTGDDAPLVLLALHLLIGIFSAVPLVAWALRAAPGRTSGTVVGAGYGAAYWLVVNTLALPAAFGDPLPWSTGPAALLPSLAVHVVYGAVTGLMITHLGEQHRRRASERA